MNNPRNILLIGAALLVIGSVLPWATVTSFLGKVDVTATDKDGAITLVIGVLIGLGAFLSKAKPGKRASWGSAIFGAIAGIVALADMSDIDGLAAGPFVDVQIGTGLYLVAIGALICLIGGLIKWPEEAAVLNPSFEERSG